jgi:uncharacterized RDD family membrane protein YckC
MNTAIQQLVNLGVTLLIALLVRHYYRHRTFPPSDRYSTFGPRFWTGSVDSCVLWPLGFITSTLLLLNIPRGLAALVVVVESLAWLVYTVLLHARYGQTIGKMVTHVRVVDFRTEGKISFQQALLREGVPMVLSLGFLGYEIFAVLTRRLAPGDLANGQALVANKALWLLTALPALWFVAEVLTMLTNEKRRALHDFIAGTVVVRTNTDERSAQPSASPNSRNVPIISASSRAAKTRDVRR